MTRWISFEGVNGVGKTYLLRQLAARLGDGCLVIDELTDRGDDTAATIIGALAATGDMYLRTGYPLTETFALASLKVRDYEQVAAMAAPPRWVLEDRGVDTVAVYQAAVLGGGPALVDQIAAIMTMWRPRPDLTILLTDDLDACIARYTARTGAPVSTADRALLSIINDLYACRASNEPDRWRVCPVGSREPGDVLDQLEAWARGVTARVGCRGGDAG